MSRPDSLDESWRIAIEYFENNGFREESRSVSQFGSSGLQSAEPAEIGTIYFAGKSDILFHYNSHSGEGFLEVKDGGSIDEDQIATYTEDLETLLIADLEYKLSTGTY